MSWDGLEWDENVAELFLPPAMQIWTVAVARKGFVHSGLRSCGFCVYLATCRKEWDHAVTRLLELRIGEGVG